MTMLDRTPSRELQEHLWVFPMDYPIKLIGFAALSYMLQWLKF
jgi:hypothetical protein